MYFRGGSIYSNLVQLLTKLLSCQYHLRMASHYGSSGHSNTQEIFGLKLWAFTKLHQAPPGSNMLHQAPPGCNKLMVFGATPRHQKQKKRKIGEDMATHDLVLPMGKRFEWEK